MQRPAGRPSAAGIRSTQAAVLNVVAHQDDDLLFLSPALLGSLAAGGPVRTVFLTAGDDGRPASYWQGRETGIRAAYAKMLGVPDRWRPEPGDPGALLTLAAAPQVSLQFLRLPDGGPGHGFARYAHQSLPQLWLGRQTRITAVDASATYTRSSLVSALTRVMASVQAGTVRTQDYGGKFGDGDHNDHHATAYLTRAASQRFSTGHWLESYLDYSTARRPANVSGTQLESKEHAFSAYSTHDPYLCTGRGPACPPTFASWVHRQYRRSRTWIA